MNEHITIRPGSDRADIFDRAVEDVEHGVQLARMVIDNIITQLPARQFDDLGGQDLRAAIGIIANAHELLNIVRSDDRCVECAAKHGEPHQHGCNIDDGYHPSLVVTPSAADEIASRPEPSVRERLDKQLSRGVITVAEYDAAIARLDAGSSVQHALGLVAGFGGRVVIVDDEPDQADPHGIPRPGGVFADEFQATLDAATNTVIERL